MNIVNIHKRKQLINYVNQFLSIPINSRDPLSVGEGETNVNQMSIPVAPINGTFFTWR